MPERVSVLEPIFESAPAPEITPPIEMLPEAVLMMRMAAKLRSVLIVWALAELLTIELPMASEDPLPAEPEFAANV